VSSVDSDNNTEGHFSSDDHSVETNHVQSDNDLQHVSPL